MATRTTLRRRRNRGQSPFIEKLLMTAIISDQESDPLSVIAAGRRSYLRYLLRKGLELPPSSANWQKTANNGEPAPDQWPQSESARQP